MIIEKKPHLPSVENLTVPFNYLLVKMDKSFETFQMKARETGIEVSQFVYDEHKNQVRIDEKLVSPFGVVKKRPMNLVYNGEKIKKLVEKYNPIRYTGEIDEDGDRVKTIVDYSALRHITELKKNSLDVDSDLEVNVGDRVHISYLHFLNAERDGLFIETQEGNMVMVKYDLLRMVVDENNQPIRMLNGWLLIEPKAYEEKTVEDNGREFKELDSGLVLLNPQKTKKTRKSQLGTILVGGTPLRGYLDEVDKRDEPIVYKGGERILYDPRYALKLENDLHQVISEKDLYLIRREGIKIDEYHMPKGFDFDKIEI